MIKQHAAFAGQAGGGKIVYLDRDRDGGLTWRCDLCSFHRTFATMHGAQQRITEHRLIKHRIQTFWHVDV